MSKDTPVPERLKIEVIFSNQQSQNHGDKSESCFMKIFPEKAKFILLFEKSSN